MYQRVHDYHQVRDLAITVGDDSVPADLRSGRALLDLDR